MKKNISYFLILLMLLITSLFISFPISPKNIKIASHYMQYACGECYANDHVDTIILPNGQELNKDSPDLKKSKLYNFLDTDTIVFYKGKDNIGDDISGKLYDFFPADDDYKNRAGCYFATAIFQGQFKRKLIYGFLYRGSKNFGVYFDATGGKIKVKKSVDKRCRSYENQLNNKVFGVYT